MLTWTFPKVPLTASFTQMDVPGLRTLVEQKLWWRCLVCLLNKCRKQSPNDSYHLLYRLIHNIFSFFNCLDTLILLEKCCNIMKILYTSVCKLFFVSFIDLSIWFSKPLGKSWVRILLFRLAVEYLPINQPHTRWDQLRLQYRLQCRPFSRPSGKGRLDLKNAKKVFKTIQNLPGHSVWKSPIMSHLNFLILAFSTNFLSY